MMQRMKQELSHDALKGMLPQIHQLYVLDRDVDLGVFVREIVCTAPAQRPAALEGASRAVRAVRTVRARGATVARLT